MENRKGRLAPYSPLDILKIFDNCHSISEITKAGAILIDVKDDGDLNENICRLIAIRMEVRKRQLKSSL